MRAVDVDFGNRRNRVAGLSGVNNILRAVLGDMRIY